ncbi:hypothetical protein WJX74_001119 [Apatococcus lobatus]|uniref:Uncharacterized protein n=1 Tax=Apatococcus lobatus TaxID=904363 RepID=A0AAW1QIF1_9CHLO
MPPSRYPAPSTWSRSLRGSASNANFLSVTGLGVKYTGPGQEDAQAASIRADHPVPADCGLYMYEVKIISSGKHGFIGVGYAAPDVALDRLPGWDGHSYGYHGDDGFAFTSNAGKGQNYGPTYKDGDVIGAVLNKAQRTISFTKNGMELGVAFSNVSEEVLYPIVGMRTPNEQILANFGSSEFISDLRGLQDDAAKQIQSQLQAVSVPTKGKAGSLMGELAFNYMLHEGLLDSAAAVARDVLGDVVQVTDQDRQQQQAQHSIQAAVEAGDVDEALRLTEAAAPGLLTTEPPLHISFQLKVLKFIELVRGKQDEAAMAYGRAELSKAAASLPDQEELQDALSLLAYDVPEASPCGNLLSPSHRAHLASSLTSAISVRQGRPAQSAIHRLLCHSVLLSEELTAIDSPAASLINMKDRLAEITNGPAPFQ